MRLQPLSGKVFSAAGCTFAAGIGMTISVIFAGPGVVLMAVGLALFVLGLFLQLITPLMRIRVRRSQDIAMRHPGKASAA